MARDAGARSRNRRRTVCRVLPRKFEPLHSGGLRADTLSALHPMLHARLYGLASARRLSAVPNRCDSMTGFWVNLAKEPTRTMFSRSRSHTAISKLQNSRPYCLWRRGSGTCMMCCKLWWPLKKRLFSAAKNVRGRKTKCLLPWNGKASITKRKRGAATKPLCRAYSILW